MAGSEGATRRIAFINEVTPGTTPATPTLQIIRQSGGSGIEDVIPTVESDEIRSDGNIPALFLGGRSARMDWNFELTHGSFESQFQSFMRNTWKAAIAVTLGVSCAVEDGGKTWTRASGSFVSDGFAVGDRVRITGFLNAGNNVTGYITTLTADVMTIAGVTGLTDETLDTGAIFTRRKQIKNGTTLLTGTYEEADLGLTKYRAGKGMTVSDFSLDASPGVPVKGSFSLIGMSTTAWGDSSLATANTAAGVTTPMSGCLGSLKEAGVAYANATALNLKGSIGQKAQEVLGSTAAYGIESGRTRISGSLSFRFISEATANKFAAETESSLEMDYKDAAGNTFTIHLPRIKFSAPVKQPIVEGAIINTMEFLALYSSTAGVLCTACIEVTA
jgi:hypothetical protein